MKKGLNALSSMVRGGRTPEEAYEELANLIGEEDAKAALKEYEKQAGLIRMLEDPLVIHKRGLRAWYAGPQDGDHCWPALEKYLREEKRWPDDAVKSIDTASTKILSHMQPAGLGSIDTRGLVVGYVQSGKTANYTALIAKAADVGYRLFIVLAGVHNALRRQTQRRLGTELVGLNKTLWAQLTSDAEDFRASAGGNTDAFLSDRGHLRILCVVKKNAFVLRRLRKWLEAGSKHVLDSCPVLIVDDEADQAGLNAARNPDERTAINRLILDIMNHLPKAAYVGYTATPFANVLVDPSGHDLYPKDFIVELPKPAKYYGAEQLFGREELPRNDDDFEDDGGVDMIRSVPHDDIRLVRPRGTSDRATFEPELAESLDEALRYLLLACAARRTRGPRKHESMLVHTTLYTDPHESLREVVADAWTHYGTLLKRKDGAFRDQLSEQWATECNRVPAADFGLEAVPFVSLEKDLLQVIDDGKVIVENGASLERLLYDDSPRTQIAVGGNTLSRGLTLEGLMVSYFVRSASAYDTLLQMGRWFGYRPGYEDLPRIWMTDELAGWFRDLATVEAEIRQDIRRYDEEELTPEEFAVRIRVHPALAVTSALKMRHALECDISYGGGPRQATIFEHRNADYLRQNLQAAESLLSSIGEPDDHRTDGRYVWENIPAKKVREFIRSYRFHDRRPDLNPDSLEGYIRAQNDDGELTSWTVVLASISKNRRGTRRIGPVEVNLLDRSQLAPRPNQSYATVGTVTTQRDLTIGLPEGQAKRGVGDPGLLLLYPIAKDSQPASGKKGKRVALDAVDDVLAVAFDFPPPKKPTPQRYVRVDLPVPQELDLEDEFEDEEAD